MDERKDRRKNTIPQAEFEAISKRAAEIVVPMLREVVLEIVRDEMQRLHNEKNEKVAHDLYAILGEAGFKGLIKIAGAVTVAIVVAGIAAVAGLLHIKGN